MKSLGFKTVISMIGLFTLLFLGTSSWYIQHVMKLKTQGEIGGLLDSILTTTEQAAYFKLKEKQSHVLTWARTEIIVQSTQELMPVQDSRQKLIASPIQTKLRTWFEPIRKTLGYQGFFIVSPEGINLASTSDSNTGEISLLTQNIGFFEKIWQGGTTLSKLLHSKIHLGKPAKGHLTMFVGAPIIDESGEIIAALAFRLDPYVDLSNLLQRGRMGESGETYAFIKEGEMISHSRFDQYLDEYGITFTDPTEIVHLEVRDPGVNLTLGEQSNVPRSKQPFTRMAISAMAGESGQDLEGYRDYRGVPVIGRWLWSDRMGFGMATEIDMAEGYAILDSNRRMVTISTFILCLLCLVIFTIIIKYFNASKKSGQILREKENILQQSQKMEAVGQLTGGIAHDFNNLLSIISGNLRFLQQDIGETSVEINELFEDAVSAVEDGSELTQSLLAFSRNRPLKTEITNVNDTIQKFIRFAERTLGKNIELDFDLPEESLYISVDPSQLENTLLNLSLNARDAMPKGGAITFGAKRYHHGNGDEYRFILSEGDYILMSVTDTGSGISSEDLPHVYEPFFTTKAVGKGSGLGLSMVWGFTQQSKGGCYISSTPGNGTTVSMVFPEVMDIKNIDKKTKDEEDKSLHGNEVILVVEDDPRVRRVTLRDLKKLGYKTLEAENAEIAKNIIESGEPVDLLFSDLRMPGEMDGHMLGLWTEENYPKIKVVVTSGYSKGKEDVSRDKAHPFPMVRKPYSIDKLAKQIRTTLTE